MNKFHLACTALLFLLSINAYSSDSFTNVMSLTPLTGSGGCQPTIVCPPDVTIDGGIQDIDGSRLPSASVAFSYCGAPNVTFTDNVGGNVCLTEITRIWTATSLNSITGDVELGQCRQQISLLPECKLICPPNACVDISDDTSIASLGTPTSSNGCVVFELWSDDAESELCDDVQRINRVWNGIFDGYEGCSITCIQTITVGDSEGPTLGNLPVNMTVNSTCDVVQWEEPIANDNCTIVTMTSNFRPGTSEFPVGNNIVTYDAFDQCGNMTSYSFIVNVLEDGTHPECPDDINIVTDDINPITVEWEVPTYSGTCEECPSARTIGGFNFVGSMEGSNYYISTVGYNYADASMRAERLGGHIVSIGSAAENQFISDKFMSHSIYIGLTDVRSEGRFAWDSGESLGYTNWSYNQPNNHQGNQDYVEMMSTGEWNDIEDKKLCFILEMPCDYVQQVGGPRLGDALYPGTYTISYTIEDGCGLLQCCSFDINIEFDNGHEKEEIETETETEQVELVGFLQDGKDNSLGFSIYPNPFEDDITVSITEFETVRKMYILTADGKLATSTTSISSVNKLSTNELNQGVHIVVLEYATGEIKYKRIIKL